MGVLARLSDGDDPGRAVRPWDRNRSGFLVGEGAAVLVLEREDHARARGVLPYAEFCGGAFGADAYHETNLNPDPSNLAALDRPGPGNRGRRALGNRSRQRPRHRDEVQRPARMPGDPARLRPACRPTGLLGEQGPDRPFARRGGRGRTGLHGLAVRDGFVPPTVNLDNPDPRCDLDGTPHVGRALPIRAALKLSIGFGGHLAAAVLRKPDGPDVDRGGRG